MLVLQMWLLCRSQAEPWLERQPGSRTANRLGPFKEGLWQHVGRSARPPRRHQTVGAVASSSHPRTAAFFTSPPRIVRAGIWDDRVPRTANHESRFNPDARWRWSWVVGRCP